MDHAQSFLLFLYGLFWAVMLATSPRYNAFPTAKLFDEEESKHHRLIWLRRTAVSLVVLNLAPIAILVYLLAYVVPATKSLSAIVGAAVSSLSVFSVIRIYHGIVASKKSISYFYTPFESQELKLQGPSGRIRAWKVHILPGLLYLLVPIWFAQQIVPNVSNILLDSTTQQSLAYTVFEGGSIKISLKEVVPFFMGFVVTIGFGMPCKSFLEQAVDVKISTDFKFLVDADPNTGWWLGGLERLLFFAAFWFKLPEIGLGWLVFKAATKWAAWQHVIRLPDTIIDNDFKENLKLKVQLGSWLYGRLALGTLYNVICGGVGTLIGGLLSP